MKYFFSICVLLYGFVCNAQTNNNPEIQTIIVGKAVSYKQSADWSKTSSQQDKKRGLETITYIRKEFTLPSGGKIAPTQSCIVESVRNSDIKSYSSANLAFFKKQTEFKIQKIITHNDGLLSIPYAIGYWATYIDVKGTIHKVIIIHALNSLKGIGLQFFIDCPEDGFSDLETEITDIIRTIQFI
jgi:hypothetical protein